MSCRAARPASAPRPSSSSAGTYRSWRSAQCSACAWSPASRAVDVAARAERVGGDRERLGALRVGLAAPTPRPRRAARRRRRRPAAARRSCAPPLSASSSARAMVELLAAAWRSPTPRRAPRARPAGRARPARGSGAPTARARRRGRRGPRPRRRAGRARRRGRSGAGPRAIAAAGRTLRRCSRRPARSGPARRRCRARRSPARGRATTRRPSHRAGRLSSRGVASRPWRSHAGTSYGAPRRARSCSAWERLRAEADRLPPSQVRALRNAVRGRVLTPSTNGYDAARVVFNRRYDGVRPPAVVRVRDPADVQAVVRWARAVRRPAHGPLRRPRVQRRVHEPAAPWWSICAASTGSRCATASPRSGRARATSTSTRRSPAAAPRSRRARARRSGSAAWRPAAGWGSPAARSGSRSTACAASTS